MRTYDIRSLLLPGVLALTAGLLALFYVSRSPAKPAQATTAGTAVYVATRDIPTGAAGDTLAASLRLVHVPAQQVAADAVTSPAQLAGRVATSPTFAGQQVTLQSFAGAAAQGTAGQLSGTLRAIQVAGDATQVLAGVVKAGDHVDVVASVKTPDGTASSGQTVVRNLLVLAAPPEASGSAGSSQSYIATLRATDAQAQRLFFVTKNGDWALELRPALHGRNSSLGNTTVTSIVEAAR
jgi:Flp pilus assembly protein CpaB